MKKMNIAVIGCGDYIQRWEAVPINASHHIVVKSLFDLDAQKAQTLAGKIGGNVVESQDQIFDDPHIDIVCLFVPPFVRRELYEKAAASGKHVICTKPLANTLEDSQAIVKATKGIRSAVFYGRTGDAAAETCKDIFESGEIGRLVLYKQDWLHHYPTWNAWATDRDKNGGPFMDAMIHNLNLARYLMGRPLERVHFFSDNHVHPQIECNDTEFMKADFQDNGSAHLFITWAADLEIFDSAGNDREHIDIFYMISESGWRLTYGEQSGKPTVLASRNGETKAWPVKELEETPYDAFALAVAQDQPFRRDIVSIEDAMQDISILENANTLSPS